MWPHYEWLHFDSGNRFVRGICDDNISTSSHHLCPTVHLLSKTGISALCWLQYFSNVLKRDTQATPFMSFTNNTAPVLAEDDVDVDDKSWLPQWQQYLFVASWPQTEQNIICTKEILQITDRNITNGIYCVWHKEGMQIAWTLNWWIVNQQRVDKIWNMSALYSGNSGSPITKSSKAKANASNAYFSSVGVADNGHLEIHLATSELWFGQQQERILPKVHSGSIIV